MMRVRLLTLAVLSLLCACEKRRNPDDEVEGLYVRAQSAFLQGKFDEALAAYAEVAAKAPNHPRLPAARGEVFLALGRFRDAAADFEHATQLDPKRATNWSRLGFARAQAGEASASEALERAIALNPKDALAHETAADLARRRKDFAVAARGYERAAGLVEGADRFRLALEAARAWNDAQQPDALLAWAKSEQDRNVASAELVSMAADVLLAKSELGGAAEAYRAAARISKRDASLWELAGEIEIRRGNVDAAQRDFEESIRIKPSATVHIALLRLALQRKDKTLAQAQLKSALQVATGSDPRETRELADGLSRMNRKADALTLLDNLASEPAMKGDVALQTQTATLARELAKRDIARMACARLADADAGVPPPCR